MNLWCRSICFGLHPFLFLGSFIDFSVRRFLPFLLGSPRVVDIFVASLQFTRVHFPQIIAAVCSSVVILSRYTHECGDLLIRKMGKEDEDDGGESSSSSSNDDEGGDEEE